MPLNDARYAELAGAVLNGTPINWASVESSANVDDRALLDQFKVLSTVADLHRRLAVPSSEENAEAGRLEQWAHLRVLERIGHGAFGNVYRAWDMRLDREVALKLVPKSATSNPRATSIIEEGRLLARVRHPNVVTIYGAEQIDDRIGLWMELVQGQTLQQIADQGKVFSATEIIDIGIEVCGAVAAVHRAGLVHRDIKAHNVMRTEDGRLVLMDFGAGGELTATPADGPSGTPLYLAPEIFAGKPATVQSDIYSLGVLLYHLAARSYPVRANSLRELTAAHERGERVDVRAVRPDLPTKLGRVIGQAIDPDPARRYQSADALASALAVLKPRSLLAPSIYAMAATALIAAVMWFAWGTRAAVSPVDRPIIAVLPLKNLSDERGSDYFVDGLTDEVIRNLAVIDGLEVRSRTSSFAFKDKPRDVREVGEQLGANLVVEGSVFRSGTKLRINAQLIQVAGDVPLWAERFDRELKDVFTIQDEISRAIVDKLRLSLGRGQRRYDTNVEAYELYLKARAVLDRRDVSNAKDAVAVFQQVIAKDPSYAPAYAGLAHAYAYWSQSYFGISFEEGLSHMRPAAQKALELDPLLAESHAAMGHLYSRERNWDKAVAEFRRALELNPSLTHIHTSYSISTLIPLGRFDEAERLMQAARRADPLSLGLVQETAILQIIGGRYGEAIQNLERVRSVDPEFPFASLHLVRALTFGGKPADALAVWEPGYADNPGRKYWLAHAYVKTGRRADVEKWPETRDNHYPYRQLVIYTALGDKDRAFDALERATVTDPQRIGLILAFPETALLRGDPRLAAFRKRFGLP